MVLLRLCIVLCPAMYEHMGIGVCVCVCVFKVISIHEDVSAEDARSSPVWLEGQKFIHMERKPNLPMQPCCCSQRPVPVLSPQADRSRHNEHPNSSSRSHGPSRQRRVESSASGGHATSRSEHKRRFLQLKFDSVSKHVCYQSTHYSQPSDQQHLNTF